MARQHFYPAANGNTNDWEVTMNFIPEEAVDVLARRDLMSPFYQVWIFHPDYYPMHVCAATRRLHPGLKATSSFACTG
ncbi:mCG142484 [Mus musculus]|nr:mCG142484 [Mus musculus]